MTAQIFQAVFCAIFAQQIKQCFATYNVSNIHNGVAISQTSAEECLMESMAKHFHFENGNMIDYKECSCFIVKNG